MTKISLLYDVCFFSVNLKAMTTHLCCFQEDKKKKVATIQSQIFKMKKMERKMKRKKEKNHDKVEQNGKKQKQITDKKN